MSSERLQQLLQFSEEDPSDPFNFYALALEYENYNVEKSLTYYNHLLQKHPDYLPTYYHAGKRFEEMGNITTALETYEKGILLARKQGNFKAAAELENVRNLCVDDGA